MLDVYKRQSLGFTVSNGQVDTSTVMLKSLKGPFVAAEGTQLPFTPVSIYRKDVYKRQAGVYVVVETTAE